MLLLLGLLLLILLLLGASVAATLTMYSIWYYERQSQPSTAKIAVDDQPLVVTKACKAIIIEALANLWLALSSPLVSWWEGRKVLPTGTGTPILLVHGYSCNRGCMGWLAWRLRQAGYRVRCVSYLPPTANVHKLVPQLKQHVRQLLTDSGSDKIHYVAHSMGGLLGRDLLSDPAFAGTVDKMICLGSPHQGSRSANLLSSMVRGAVPQMTYQSDYIKQLPRRPGGAQYYGICSSMDALVLPVSSAVLPGAVTQQVDYLGHCSLLYSPQVLDQLLAFLAEQ